MLTQSLRRGLEEDGYAVDLAFDGEEAAPKAENTKYDAIVLDLMLPKQDGFSLLRRWRSRGVSSHILVLTARGGLEDKVRGLDLVADDYMTKPFDLEELLARLRALVRGIISSLPSSSRLISKSIQQVASPAGPGECLV